MRCLWAHERGWMFEIRERERERERERWQHVSLV
jgi:hypothetical protein